MMQKKTLSFCLCFAMIMCLAACGNDVIVDVVTNEKTVGQAAGSKDEAEIKTDTGNDASAATAAGTATIAVPDLKIGVLYIGSASEPSGYTYAHELGIQGMAANLGLSENQVVRKENVDDSDKKKIEKALQECVDEGCNVIFTTSWGYMEPTAEFAKAYPDIYFAHGTGYLSNGSNFTNYFGRIYQARYLSGIVAGLKTKSNKIGYVSAQGVDNSECTGGIDAFAIGVESVNPDAEVYVAVTNSWYDEELEKGASQALVKEGCDVLAQHCDTTQPQEVSEKNGTWAIGYNSDMSKETPETTLTSVIWNWNAYYTSFVESIVSGSYDGSDYYGGMAESLVGLTALADFCGEGTEELVEQAQQKIMQGEFNIFDGELKTNDGSSAGKAGGTLDDGTITGGIDWYYHNVKVLGWND